MNKSLSYENQSEQKDTNGGTHSLILLVVLSLFIVLGILLVSATHAPLARASEPPIYIPAYHLEFTPFYKDTSTLRLDNPNSLPVMVSVQFRDSGGVYQLNLMYSMAPNTQLYLIGSSFSQLLTGESYTVIVSSTAPITGELIQSPPETAQERIDSLIQDINALVSGENLYTGQGNSLIVKLNIAVFKLDEDHPIVAVNLLNAFINEVISLIDEGVLTQESGQPLIEEAYEIIGMIQN